MQKGVIRVISLCGLVLPWLLCVIYRKRKVIGCKITFCHFWDMASVLFWCGMMSNYDFGLFRGVGKRFELKFSSVQPVKQNLMHVHCINNQVD
jgi:hypothetical protein